MNKLRIEISQKLRHNRIQSNRGAALLIGIILLVVMTIGGLAAIQSSSTNEKIISNQRNKSIATLAAETGAQRYINWFNSTTTASWPTTSGEKDAWATTIANSNSGLLASNIANNSFGYFWVDPSSVTWNDSDETVALTVTGHSLNSPTNGSILATSNIELLLKKPIFSLVPSMIGSPLGIAGGVSSFDAANSNNFKVTSTSTPAITTTSNSSTASVAAAASAKRPNNYTGVNTDGSACSNPCIQTATFDSTWGDANALMSMIETLKTSNKVSYYQGNKTFGNGDLNNSTPITIVTGEVTFQGNPNDYNGLLIVLGGAVNVTGGGNFTLNGGLYLANVQGSAGNYTFASGGLSFGGGGGMNINYDPNPQNISGTPTAPVQKWIEK